jgi:hypothetical protein
VFDGAGDSRYQLKDENFFGYPERIYPKINGWSEYGIVMNELFYEAHRNRDNLVVTAIDFTKAFGSVPHELIMSTMKQRNFPRWTQNIVADLYNGATSVIEKRACRSDKIAWK